MIVIHKKQLGHLSELVVFCDSWQWFIIPPVPRDRRCDLFQITRRVFANQCSDSGTGVAIHTLQRTLDCRAVARNDDNFIVIIVNIFSFHSKLAGKVLQSLLGVCLIAFHATSFLYFYWYVWWHYVIMIKFHHHGCPSLSHWTQSVGITKHLW